MWIGTLIKSPYVCLLQSFEVELLDNGPSIKNISQIRSSSKIITLFRYSQVLSKLADSYGNSVECLGHCDSLDNNLSLRSERRINSTYNQLNLQCLNLLEILKPPTLLSVANTIPTPHQQLYNCIPRKLSPSKSGEKRKMQCDGLVPSQVQYLTSDSYPLKVTLTE